MEDEPRFGSASLAQVAALTGRVEDDVLESATRSVGEAAASRGWLTPEAVEAVLSDVTPLRPLSDAEALIIRAFQLAQESAKTNWSSMAVPVLKNRLLQLTSQSFKEADYGSPSVWHFVTKFPELIALEGVRMREHVRLIEPEKLEPFKREQAGPLDPTGMGRIREDLWRAVFDYSSGITYVWDEAIGRARSSSDAEDKNALVLPTLTPDSMAALRAEFVQLQGTVSEADRIRLADWEKRGGPTIALPAAHRNLWNAHIKSHAANALRAFFVREGLSVPRDLVERAHLPAEPEREVERLRRLAHRYIDAMTADELARLPIGLEVIRRVPEIVTE